MGGNQKYRDNFDAINWANSRAPDENDESVGSSVCKLEVLNYDIVPLKEIEGSIQHDVREFHRVMGQPIICTPCVPSDERVRLRLRLIHEEYCELLTACGVAEPRFEGIGVYSDILQAINDVRARDVDLVESSDALADLSYVVEGMNLEFGIDSEAVLAEVQRSNMSKLGEDGNPVYNADGKVTKGPNYSPPDIAKVLGL